MTLSCFELGERMLSLDEALNALQELTPQALESENVPLQSALNRVLAKDAISPIDVPQNTNAAMDGIALSWAGDGQTRFAIQADVLAGSRLEGRLVPGQAVTITTGAPLPEGADTVIMSEQLVFEQDSAARRVTVQQPDRVRQGQNVRQAGEDIARGAKALAAGTRLAAQHLGLLASLGMAQAAVVRRPRVAVFSTGDEVTAPGETLPPAGIYDANRLSLHGLLTRLGCEVIDLGILEDDFTAIRDALAAAAQAADMVITSGGVSVGHADWTRRVLDQTGRLGFWRIAIRPGRPLAFGTLGEREIPFFGLPGNPVAVMVTFLQFVQPLLRTLQGEPHWQPRRLTAIADEPLKSRTGRVDFLRGIYRCDDQGRLHVKMTGRQGSGILSSMAAANCLIEIEAPRAEVAQGETVTLQPFEEMT